jgi:hypothetical protein
MATKHGVNSRIYMGATTPIPVTETHNIDISFETDFAEDSSQGDSFKTYLAGLADFTMAIDRWYDSAEYVLLDAVIARTVLKFYFYPDATDATVYLYGTGQLGGGGFKAGIGDVVDQSYQFRASAQPTFKHP